MHPGSTKTDERWVSKQTQSSASAAARSSPAVVREVEPPSCEDDDGLFDEGSGLPERLGRFWILRRLGSGAMGTVLEGYDETLDRKVAVKLLHDGSAGTHRQRLLREAQALARLSHPNVVGVYDAWDHDGRLCIAMELVDGQTLWDWQKTPRPWPDCLRVYLEAGRGLVAAHAEGIVHRDFKPANCILDTQGRVKVLDFGLARGLDDDDDDDLAIERNGPTADVDDEADPTQTAADPERSALSLRLTRTGATLGTPAYMAPEQASGRSADARSDQFSFCVSLYEALYGERPFAGNPGLALAAGHEPSFGTAKSPAGLPGVPAWLQAVLRRGLSARKGDRFATMSELLAALARGQRRRRRRRWLGITAVGVLVFAGAGVLAAMRDTPCEGLREAPLVAWGPRQRAAVHSALLGSSSEHAQGAWEATAAGLDAHAGAWSDARARACEATRVDRVAGEDLLELRMACLDRHAIQVAATVDLLMEADDALITHAAQLVRSLPAVDLCLDAERLHGTPPVSPSLEQQAREIRGLVARSWAFDAAGQTTRGLDVAEQAIAEAEALGAEGAPLLAEAQLNRGRLYRTLRRLTEARDELQAVLQHAEQTADEGLALDALQELLMVAQVEDDRSAFGAWMTVARGKLHRLADEPYTGARLSHLEGLQALDDGELHEATALLETAVNRYRQLGPAAVLDGGRALLELGVAQGRLHQDERAEQSLAQVQALAEREGLLPLLADAVQQRGQLYFDRGRSEEAERWLMQSLELRVAFDGPDAPVTIPPRSLLAMLLQQRGEHEAAKAMVEVVRGSLGPDVPVRSRVQVMSLLARFHRRQGDWLSALADYQGAEQALASSPTPDPVEQAMLHSNVGDCLRMLKRFDAAHTRYDRALEGLHIHAPKNDFRFVHPLYGLASLLDEQGDRVGARDVYRRALEVHEAAPRDREMGAMLRWKLARLVLDAPSSSPSEQQQAVQLLDAALSQYRELDHPLVAELTTYIDQCGPRCRAQTTPPPRR